MAWNSLLIGDAGCCMQGYFWPPGTDIWEACKYMNFFLHSNE